MTPTLAQRFLKLVHPKTEAERMMFRLILAKAIAEAEDLTMVISTCRHKKTSGSRE